MTPAKLPSKWRLARLGECCEIASGATPRRDTPAYWGGDIPWVTPKDLTKLCNAVLPDSPEKITEAGLRSCSAKILPEGTVLFSSRAPIGLVAIAGRPMATNQGFKSLVPGPEVHSKYLYHCMRNLTPAIQHMGRGATFKEVSKAIMEDVEVPLPPLEEQKRIAAILDKADALRRKRAEALQLTNQFLQSLFLDMFGDPVTNPKGWKTAQLGDLLEFMTSGSRGWARYYAEKGAKFLRIQNVGRNALTQDDMAHVNAPETAEARRTRVQPGDVLLSITADLGRTAVVPSDFGEAYINQHLALLRTNKVHPLYLSAYLASDGGARQIGSLNRNGVKAGLNFDDIRCLKILMPGDDLQTRFASIHGKHQSSFAKLKSATSVAQHLFESLTHRAFQGDL